MSSDVVISARNLSKTYRVYAHPLNQLLNHFSFGKVGECKEFHALRDVSFDIARGESIGIIGRNGSGKSTLLQLICGIRKPTGGTLQINGRISALLELGAGFHPEFTGRENVFMQGAIQGLSKRQMEERFDEIAAFADIGEYIDQPVKTYSSGMFVRLAFAVAVSVDPDILLVDEALAVGDGLFQKRCHGRIAQLRQNGMTLVIVSHDLELVRGMTQKTLLLDRGAPRLFGVTKQATFEYRRLLSEESNQSAEQVAAIGDGLDKEAKGYGTGEAKITGLRIFSANGMACDQFKPGQRMFVEVSVQAECALSQCNVSIVVRTVSGLKVYSWGTLNQDISIWAGDISGDAVWERTFPPGSEITALFELDCNLGAGNYEVQAVVSREHDRYFGNQEILHWREEMAFFKVVLDKQGHFFGGLCDMRAKVNLDD